MNRCKKESNSDDSFEGKVEAFSNDEIEFGDSGETTDTENDKEERTSSSKKRYIQRPRKAWYSNPYLKDWLVIDGKQVECKFCEIIFKNVRYSSLKTHCFAKKHVKAEQIYKEKNNIEDSNNKSISNSKSYLEFEKDTERSNSKIYDFQHLEGTISSINDLQPLKDIFKVADDEKINKRKRYTKTGRKKRRLSENSEETTNEGDIMAMKLAIEKDKVKAIGDMSKAIRYLADSIRLAIQNNNSAK